jgi:hypothetical protein
MTENSIEPYVDSSHAEYDGLTVRFNELIGDLDERTAQVLAAHFAVERELDVTLSYFLPQPEKLGAIKFGHKVQLLRACCPDPYVDIFLDPILRLDNLRNALAHNNKAQIDGCFSAFTTSIDEFAKAGVEATAGGVVTAARILTEGLTFVRVENFSCAQVKQIVAAHVATRRAAHDAKAPSS